MHPFSHYSPVESYSGRRSGTGQVPFSRSEGIGAIFSSPSVEATPPSSPRGEDPASSSHDSIEVQESGDIPAQLYDDALIPTTVPVNPFDPFKYEVLGLLQAHPREKFTFPPSEGRGAPSSYPSSFSSGPSTHENSEIQLSFSTDLSPQIRKILKEADPGVGFTAHEIKGRFPDASLEQIKSALSNLRSYHHISSEQLSRDEQRSRTPSVVQYFYNYDDPDENSDLGAKVTNQRDPE